MHELVLLSALLSALTTAPTAFVEVDGLLVIEAESASSLGAGWVRVPPGTSTANAIDEPEAALGPGFIVWEGSASGNTVANGRTPLFVRITNPGTYRFLWRSQVGFGTNTTEHNDSWLKIDADAFYGYRRSDNSTVCPGGFDPARNDCSGRPPNGSSREGFFKVYTSGATGWKWQASTSDNDAHDIFARFETAGDYALTFAGRSSFHVLDRIVLFRDDVTQAFATDPIRDESQQLPIDRVFADGFEN